jgi:hypothetical protein
MIMWEVTALQRLCVVDLWTRRVPDANGWDSSQAILVSGMDRHGRVCACAEKVIVPASSPDALRPREKQIYVAHAWSGLNLSVLSSM